MAAAKRSASRGSCRSTTSGAWICFRAGTGDWGLRLEASRAVIKERAAKIKLILFDVDGVLTDGTILLHPDGTESKQFDIKDGSGIVWAQRLGITVGFLSARTSTATTQRAAQLGITLVHQGVGSKLDAYQQMVDGVMLEDE